MDLADRVDANEDEARLVEMADRIDRRLVPIYFAAGLLMLSSVPSYGWWIMLPVCFDAAKAVVTKTLLDRGAPIELTQAIDQYTSVVLFGAAIFFAGGAGSPFYPFLLVYAVLFPALFSKVHVRWGIAITLASAILAALGPEKAVDNLLLLRVGTMICLLFILGVLATELMRSEVRYRAASLVDNLTGLPNRRAFDAELEAVGQRVAEGRGPAALVVGDIDHFKKINDEHGHDVGDEVLVAIAAELSGAFRTTDVAYRIGGEEFAFILVGVDPELAHAMADSLCDRIAVAGPAGREISMSFGVAMHAAAESNGTWFRRADSALFTAKRTGRNRVELAASSI